MFVSIPFSAREVKATEAVLERIYAAAYLGLKGDSLALTAGLHPHELRTLIELDPAAEIAARKGRADSEAAHARMLSAASLNGDAKASLAILQHVHGWTAKQSVEVTASVSAELAEVLNGTAAQLLAKIRALPSANEPG
jgi:hypothetical protein